MNFTQISDRRSLALQVWGEQLNGPYIWGGDDPVVGFDCSGLALEGLKAAGIVPRDLDTTAHNLLNVIFKTRIRLTQASQMRPGCLIFWENGAGRIRHVEIVMLVLQGTIFTIGASGGGSKTPDAKAAAAQNAYVKIRPAAPGWACAIDPFLGGTP